MPKTPQNHLTNLVLGTLKNTDQVQKLTAGEGHKTRSVRPRNNDFEIQNKLLPNVVVSIKATIVLYVQF